MTSSSQLQAILVPSRFPLGSPNTTRKDTAEQRQIMATPDRNEGQKGIEIDGQFHIFIISQN